MTDRIKVLLLAGGVGKRFGQPLPKQFAMVGDRPVIMHTLRVFDLMPEVERIIVVVHPEWKKRLSAMINNDKLTHSVDLVTGGETSQDSLFNGIEFLARFADNDSCVVVHESVRPMIDADLIRRGLECYKKNGNALAAIRGNEAVAESTDGLQISRMHSRSNMYFVQMPQIYSLNDLVAVMSEARQKKIVEQSLNTLIDRLGGRTLFLFEGGIHNRKLTLPEDMIYFKTYLDDAK